MEATMAKESDLHTRGILGDINPVPAARDHITGPSGVEDGDEDTERPGSRDVSQRTTGNAGTEVGGTRNYRTGTGVTGGDIGNRPE
jgi:hypothetical protein